MSGASILVLMMLASTRPSAPHAYGVQLSAQAARENVRNTTVDAQLRGPGSATHSGRAAGPPATGACRPSDNSNGYVNPLAGAEVTPRRIDQGIDYAGSGTLAAIGSARIISVATVDTGWPGAFIEYQLLGGPEAGCYVYYAEGVTPVPDLQVGKAVRAGEVLATIIPGFSSGIEVGWGAGNGTKSYAASSGGWSAVHEAYDIPSSAGLCFSTLVEALGGPPGKVEG
ncbi:MAG TPA: hypothetical protein VLP43_02195 [Solirubrobacteraceae bacterium]|nr:hypothetical protein [Solirubrobacteraceae bacterium]